MKKPQVKKTKKKLLPNVSVPKTAAVPKYDKKLS
jgi:hypothetical protein